MGVGVGGWGCMGDGMINHIFATMISRDQIVNLNPIISLFSLGKSHVSRINVWELLLKERKCGT